MQVVIVCMLGRSRRVVIQSAQALKETGHDYKYMQVVVHRILAGCTQAESRLLQPGDSLLSAGTVESSQGRWNPKALAALLPALMSDSSIGCVMQRPRRSPGRREGYIWYAYGASGDACSDAVAMGALADHSVLVVPQQGEPRRPGRQMFVSYHRMRQGEVRHCESRPCPCSCRSVVVATRGTTSCTHANRLSAHSPVPALHAYCDFRADAG